MDLVTPGFGLIFWTSVVFIILLILLKRMAWTPILNNVDARNKSIEEALEAAKNARDEISNLKADNDRILKEARAERDEMLKEARELKANIISEAKNAAKDEADKMIASAKVVIENEKAGAISELKNTVGSLSVDIAEKVLRAELKDVDKQNAFIADMLKDTLSKMQDRSEFDGKGNLFKSAAIRHKFENLVLFSGYSRKKVKLFQ